MHPTEKALLNAVVKLTKMNSASIVQLYKLHFQLAEKVLTLTPADPALLRHISQTEQILCHLEHAEAVWKKHKKKPKRD